MVVDLEALAAKLTPAEMRELNTMLSYRLATKGDATFSRYEIDVYDCLYEALGLNSKQRISLAVFSASYGRAKYASRVEALQEFIERGSGALLRVPQLHAMSVRILRMLSDYLLVREIPVSPTSMLNNFGALEVAVEVQFPGYRAAKLLHRMAA